MDSIEQYEALLKDWGYGKEWGYKDTLKANKAKQQRKETMQKVAKTVKFVVKTTYVKTVTVLSQVKLSSSKVHA